MKSISQFAALALSSLFLSLSAKAASSYQDVKGTIADACLSCHSSEVAYGNIILETEAQVVAKAQAIISVIESGAMPIGQPEFKDSPKASDLLDYLQSTAL